MPSALRSSTHYRSEMVRVRFRVRPHPNPDPDPKQVIYYRSEMARREGIGVKGVIKEDKDKYGDYTIQVRGRGRVRVRVRVRVSVSVRVKRY